jgi:glucose-6-phosphate 1-dehydrogenase
MAQRRILHRRFVPGIGDLAKRKVLPAMYDLAQHNSLGERYSIVGFARTPMTNESFRSMAGEAAKTISEVGPIDPAKWDEFAANLYYSHGDYSDQNSYAELAKFLQSRDAEKESRRKSAVLLVDASEFAAHRRATGTRRTGAPVNQS